MISISPRLEGGDRRRRGGDARGAAREGDQGEAATDSRAPRRKRPSPAVVARLVRAATCVEPHRTSRTHRVDPGQRACYNFLFIKRTATGQRYNLNVKYNN